MAAVQGMNKCTRRELGRTKARGPLHSPADAELSRAAGARPGWPRGQEQGTAPPAPGGSAPGDVGGCCWSRPRPSREHLPLESPALLTLRGLEGKCQHR